MKNKRTGVFQRGLEEAARQCFPDVLNQTVAIDAFAAAESLAERDGVRVYVRAAPDGSVSIIRADDCSDEDKTKSLAYFDPIT